MNLFLLLSLLCISITGICGYAVIGNKIYDPNGMLVRIRGVDRPSFEWIATGSQASLSDYTLMRNWGSNVVRISTNQDFWLAASTYAATIDQQISWAREAGMGVILDLHWNNGGQQNMADRNSITFWSQVAARYKNNPWVMFELYNEPHDVSWSQWLSGDSSYAGMQNMYDAVRTAGANNTVIVCGLNWGFDLSGVGAGYRVRGNNIAYASHPYDYNGKQLADWPAAFGYLTATDPIILTEFGQYCATNTYVADLLSYAEANGIHWTAWAWFVSGCAFPSIIADWNGTPAPGVGVLVKNYLASYAPTGLPTVPPPTAAPTAMVVYSDALQATWQDWSWSTSYSLSDATYAHSGSKAIRFELVGYQGLYFHSATTFQAGSYSQLAFYANGGPSAKIYLASVTLYGSGDLPVGSAMSFSASANQWTQVIFSLSTLGATASTSITGIVFQSNADSSAGSLYIDDIIFTAGSGTSAPTTAPTKSPTTEPTTVPTNAPTAAPAPPTTAPTAPTVAPTKAPTTAPNPPGTCGASSVYFVQNVESTWQSEGKTFVDYNVEVHHTCSNKILVELTISVCNWNPVEFWSLLTTSSSNVLTLPTWAAIPASSPLVAGYISSSGQAVFTPVTPTFQ